MARPKRDPDAPSAKDRLEAAFWELMAEEPYDSITIAQLADRAGVNHNTIYYHYGCIDDLAIAAFERGIPDNIESIFEAVINGGSVPLGQIQPGGAIFQQWEKGYLFLNSGSSMLVQHLQKRLIDYWCQATLVRKEDLTDDQRLDLEIIFTCMTTVMKRAFERGDPSCVASMLRRPLGKAAIATLRELNSATSS